MAMLVVSRVPPGRAPGGQLRGAECHRHSAPGMIPDPPRPPNTPSAEGDSDARSADSA